MKIHVCTQCRIYGMTSRRKDCFCKTCNIEMIRMPIQFDNWWDMDLQERKDYVNQFVEGLRSKSG